RQDEGVEVDRRDRRLVLHLRRIGHTSAQPSDSVSVLSAGGAKTGAAFSCMSGSSASCFSYSFGSTMPLARFRWRTRLSITNSGYDMARSLRAPHRVSIEREMPWGRGGLAERRLHAHALRRAPASALRSR